MDKADLYNNRVSEDAVREDLQKQPRIFYKLAENALTVAESLRDNYFKNRDGSFFHRNWVTLFRHVKKIS